MAQQIINIGAAPLDRSGDLLRDSFDKANANFTELYGVAAIVYSIKMNGATGDGATDDRVNMQAVIDLVPAGSKVIVPDGTYVLSRSNPGVDDWCLNIPKSLEIHIMTGANIKLIDGEIANGTDEVYMLEIASSGVVIEGYGTVTMNRAGQTDTTIGTNIGTRICINSNGGTYDNIQIKNILVDDAMGDGMRLKGANNSGGQLTNIVVNNIRMTNCREGVLFHWANIIQCNFNRLLMDNSTGAQDGFETSECDDYEFIGNYVEGARGSGYDLFFAGSRCICSLNTAKLCGSGIAVGNNTGAGGPGTDYVVSNNLIDGVVLTFGIGVYLNTGANRVLFDGNRIRDVQLQHAVDISAGSGITFTNTQIDGVTIGNGFFIRAGVDGTIIRGGRIENVTGGSGSGIRCDADNCAIGGQIKMENITSFALLLNGDGNNINGIIAPADTIDDNGISNKVLNSEINVLDITNATTPIHHSNIVAGAWVA